MTIPFTIDTRYALVSDDELLASYVVLESGITDLVGRRDRIQQELERRMTERGATELPHPTIECVLKYPTPTVDTNKLMALNELLAPMTIEEGFTPEHTEARLVPAKFDMTVVNTWKKYGKEVADIIEGAKLPTRPRLVVKRKRKKAAATP